MIPRLKVRRYGKGASIVSDGRVDAKDGQGFAQRDGGSEG